MKITRIVSVENANRIYIGWPYSGSATLSIDSGDDELKITLTVQQMKNLKESLEQSLKRYQKDQLEEAQRALSGE